jgi:hypothetical protein
MKLINYEKIHIKYYIFVYFCQFPGMQIASFLRSITLSSVACLAVRFSYSVPHKRQDFGEGGGHKMCVFIFSTTVIRNILRRLYIKYQFDAQIIIYSYNITFLYMFRAMNAHLQVTLYTCSIW